MLATIRVIARLQKIPRVDMLMLGLLLLNPGVMEAGVGQQAGKVNSMVGGCGRLKIIVKRILNVNGSISADEGDGGLKGGGCSGGSMILHVPKL